MIFPVPLQKKTLPVKVLSKSVQPFQILAVTDIQKFKKRIFCYKYRVYMVNMRLEKTFILILQTNDRYDTISSCIDTVSY